jgi:hypothetical protein
MADPAPLRLALRSSHLAAAFVVVTHLATAALIAWLPGNAAWRALAVVAVGAHAVWSVRGAALRSLPASIVTVELSPDRRVTLVRRDATNIAGRAMADSYVGEWIATLVVRPDDRRWPWALLLLPDMAGAEELRRFRVLLRLGRPADD